MEEKEREERKELAGAAGSAATVARHCRRRAKRRRVTAALPSRMRRETIEGERESVVEKEKARSRGTSKLRFAVVLREVAVVALRLAIVILGGSPCCRWWSRVCCRSELRRNAWRENRGLRGNSVALLLRSPRQVLPLIGALPIAVKDATTATAVNWGQNRCCCACSR